MTLDEATFVVTDTETTGAKAGRDRITEIGAVKVCGGEIVDVFQHLVNPERTIPARITKLTGITTAMVFEEPTIDAVLPEYLDFLGDGILVAHNLPFDARFLNAACKRTGRAELDNDTLCTLRLARRLLPGLKSKGLTRLAQFYGLTVNGRHRALGDAEATGIILKRFLRQVDFEHAIDTVSDLLSFQHRRYRSVRSTPKHLQRLRDEVVPDVPARPGVYAFYSQRGRLLYIGKAKQLDRRVKSYFSSIESLNARKRKMMKKVRRIEWTETRTELEALLLESRRIKEEKPSYNRAQRRYRRRPFIRLDTSADFPTVAWSRTLEDDGAEYYGPLRNIDRAEAVVDIIGRFFQLRECGDAEFRLGSRCLYADLERCTAPCETEDHDAYQAALDRVRAFLTGQDRSILGALKERMQAASDNLAFEKAAAFRDTHDHLARMLETQSMVSAPIRQHNAALLHPCNSGTADVLLVRFGRFVDAVTDVPQDASAPRDVLQSRIEAHFHPDQERPATLSKRDVDEIRLLAHWMYRHRDTLQSVRWTPGESAPAFTRRVCNALAALPA
jgi:DNA polymerase-3 subunit epsilon